MSKKRRSRNVGVVGGWDIGKQPPFADESYAVKVFVSSELAEKFLVMNKKNRGCPNNEIEKHVRILRYGEWRVNGATIVFSKDGILRDGQTRLKAIVRSKISAWMWIIFDVDNDCFDTMDQIRKRSLDHLLIVDGYSNCRDLAKAVKLVYKHDSDVPKISGGFIPQHGLHLIRERPDIIASMESTRGISGIYSWGSAAAFHCLMSKRDTDLADKFWEGMIEGVSSRSGNGKRKGKSPVFVARDRLVGNKATPSRLRLKDYVMDAIVVKGWNLFRNGKTCSKISWNPDKEKFPEIE